MKMVPYFLQTIMNEYLMALNRFTFKMSIRDSLQLSSLSLTLALTLRKDKRERSVAVNQAIIKDLTSSLLLLLLLPPHLGSYSFSC